MGTKEKFHHLIDTISDMRLLNSYYLLIQQLHNRQTGELWKSLSPAEQEELMMAYEESFDPDNLLSHKEVKKQIQKWLGK